MKECFCHPHQPRPFGMRSVRVYTDDENCDTEMVVMIEYKEHNSNTLICPFCGQPIYINSDQDKLSSFRDGYGKIFFQFTNPIYGSDPCFANFKPVDDLTYQYKVCANRNCQILPGNKDSVLFLLNYKYTYCVECGGDNLITAYALSEEHYRKTIQPLFLEHHLYEVGKTIYQHVTHNTNKRMCCNDAFGHE